MNNAIGTLIIAAASTTTFTNRDILLNKKAIMRTVNEIEQKSGISRRAFLGGLLGTAASAAFFADPDKLLWTPAKKTVFVPPVNTDVTGYTEEDQRLVLEYMGGFADPALREAQLFGRSVIGMIPEDEFRESLRQARLQLFENDGIMYPTEVKRRPRVSVELAKYG